MANQNNLLDSAAFAHLSPQEREVAVQALKEILAGGSDTLEKLKYADYKEMPVDILTFIKDRNYLGNAWHLADGKCKLFPYWESKLKELFPDNITTNVNNFILSGARGLGKSEIAVTCGAYLMHRIMCLKDPYLTLNLKPTEQIAFAFMNITEELATEIGVTKFQNTVQSSPWFMARGTLTGRDNPVWNPPKYINIIIGSQPRHVIGQAIFFAFFDEISFIPTQDIEKQKARAIDMIDTAVGGMKTRFTYRGQNPTLLCLGSSKRSEKSFLEEHTKKKLASEKENVLVVDEPVWNIRPPEEYSGVKFRVALGNKFLSSAVIPDGVVDLSPFINKGYKILEVPVEYKANFLDNIDRALCDFAGISSSDLTKYIAAFRWQACKKPDLKNPFIQDVIEVGNAPEDRVQYKDYFDLTRVDPKMKSKPLYIHLDMSISGDKTGIAGVWIRGKKPPQDGQSASSQELMFQLAFSVSVKAPRGYQISFEKNRQFIYWLKSQGFNIKGISSDTFQSADMLQQLQSKGYNYSIISVDRVEKVNDTTHICKPYHYFRNTLYEERFVMYDSLQLTTEALDLERNSAGKIDHPEKGSKDAIDAVVGSMWNASQNSERFAFDYGETVEDILRVNSEGKTDERQQVSIEFEQALQEMFTPSSIKQQQKKTAENNDSLFLDFGMGPSAPVNAPVTTADGMLIW